MAGRVVIQDMFHKMYIVMMPSYEWHGNATARFSFSIWRNIVFRFSYLESIKRHHPF
jgi:hypothetical protein